MFRIGTGLRSAICLAVAGCIGLAGCAFGTTQPSYDLSSGLNCVDDSAQCMAKRKAALAQIMSDKSNAWVDERPAAQADASGVRLFAFKKRKRQLNCRQLKVGYLEAKSARQRLRASNDPRLTPALISRGAILGDEVAKELKREIRRRGCKPVV